MIDIHPVGAARMVARLSEFWRLSLENSGDHEIALADAIAQHEPHLSGTVKNSLE